MAVDFFNRKGELAMPELPKLPSPPVKAENESVNELKSAVVTKISSNPSKNLQNDKTGKFDKKSFKKLNDHRNNSRQNNVARTERNSNNRVPQIAQQAKQTDHGEIRETPSYTGGSVLDKYSLQVDGAHARVEIRKDHHGMSYNLYIPEVSTITSTFLDEIRNELISATTVSTKELTDSTLFFRIKKRFMDDSRRLLREKLPHTKEDVEDFLVGTLIMEMLGLGKIEYLISDEHLEEIVIPSAKEPIRVYYKKYGWLATNIRVGREEEIINYSNIIARRVGRQITVLNPLLDAHLVSGDRINSVLYPISTKGNTITIRKFARDPFTIIDLINSKTCSLEIAALLWLAIEYEMNVLISGGTGSGKTSFLNACMPFIPPNQRIISIEDTRELMLPEFLYWCPLVTRTPNAEGKGEVSMLDLLVNSLRMRPDRIILGEMRREKEAMVLFEAMHTGHSTYSTVHADSAPETISRLVNPPLNVPPNLLKSVNLNVVMFRDRRKNTRRILQVAEFDADKMGAKANIIYRLAADRDELVKHSESSKFFEDLSRNTGLSENEIKEVLKKKQEILGWLIKNNMRSLEEVGRVLNLYYTNRDLLVKAIQKNDKSIIIGSEEKEAPDRVNKTIAVERVDKEILEGAKKQEEPVAVVKENPVEEKEREKKLAEQRAIDKILGKDSQQKQAWK